MTDTRHQERQSLLVVAFFVGILTASAWVVAGATSTRAADTDTTKMQAFYTWVANFKAKARRAGIKQDLLDRAFANVKPDKSALKSFTSQPEVVSTAGSYVAQLVSQSRIEAGRAALEANRALLQAVEDRYGVDAHVLAALWGIESFYGKRKGNRDTIQALTTLAAKGGRRETFWRKQLMAALRIVQNGHVPLSGLRGSWAGAMGHVQFIPTTFEAYAVDFDGDGRRDVWSSKGDALASAATYLKRSGWIKGEPWGLEVVLPDAFNFVAANEKGWAPLASWKAKGVMPARRFGWPSPATKLQLFLPSGAEGPKFLISKNFKALKRYNPSSRYALALGHLSDVIAGAPGLTETWPGKDLALRRGEAKELQRLLALHGHAVGAIDGIVGGATRSAIRDFQQSRGLPADGHPDRPLLARLRGEAERTSNR